jgi:hypothetical protein
MKDLDKIKEEGKMKTRQHQGAVQGETPTGVVVAVTEINSKISRQTTPVEFAFTSIRSPITKKNYLGILRQFFDHVGLPGNTIEEKGQVFLNKANGMKGNMKPN